MKENEKFHDRLNDLIRLRELEKELQDMSLKEKLIYLCVMVSNFSRNSRDTNFMLGLICYLLGLNAVLLCIIIYKLW